jgi:hypothetical protein
MIREHVPQPLSQSNRGYCQVVGRISRASELQLIERVDRKFVDGMLREEIGHLTRRALGLAEVSIIHHKLYGE